MARATITPIRISVRCGKFSHELTRTHGQMTEVEWFILIKLLKDALWQTDPDRIERQDQS